MDEKYQYQIILISHCTLRHINMPQYKSELNYLKQSMEHYIEQMIGKNIVARIIALTTKRRVIDSND